MPITRLICTQGPAQLIDIISILLSQKEEQKQEYRDILVIGGLCMSGDFRSSEAVVKITTLISSCWKFDAVYDISRFEYYLDYIARIAKRLGRFPSLILLRLVAKIIRRITNLDELDQIYVCRNWQMFNEIMLFTYASSEKICYGDLGNLDINDERQQQGLTNPNGFISIDKSYLVFPPKFTQETFNGHEINVVSPNHKRRLVNEISKSGSFTSLAKFCTEKLDSNILITLSNGTEAGTHCSLSEEIQFYISIVLSQSNLYDTVWIKPHPRQTLNQSQILCNLIKKTGRRSYCIDEEFSRYPLELYIPHLSCTKVICLYSYSGVVSSLLGYKKVIAGLDERVINLFVSEEYKQSFTEYGKLHEKMMKEALKDFEENCSLE